MMARVSFASIVAAGAFQTSAPACTSTLSFEGLGTHNGTSLDGDYYWIPEYGVQAYTQQLDTVNFLELGIGCQHRCNSDEQTALADGKWALTLRGSGMTFNDNELVAVCSEGCPPAVFPGAWPADAGVTTWSEYSGGSARPLKPKKISCGTAPQRCTTGITLKGFGAMNDPNGSSHELDGDFMWNSGSPYNYYENWLGEEWFLALSVGEDTGMAGKWALTLNGNDHHFGIHKLAAFCVEGCPPVVGYGPPGWPAGVGATTWQKFDGSTLKPESVACCERQPSVCDACDGKECLKHTKYSVLLPGIPLGCKAGTSSCCANNFDTEPGLWGHCACGQVPTVCAHNTTAAIAV